MPGCVCWVSENASILNDTSSCKNIPILNGFSALFIPTFNGNIKGTQHSIVVIWVNIFQNELTVEIDSKCLVRAIGKVLLMKFS